MQKFKVGYRKYNSFFLSKYYNTAFSVFDRFSNPQFRDQREFFETKYQNAH